MRDERRDLSEEMLAHVIERFDRFFGASRSTWKGAPSREACG